MNVLMTVDAVGGVWTYALELARGLAPHGVHITLACMGPRPDAAQQEEAAALDNVALHVREYRLEWMPDAAADVEAAGPWLLDLAAKTDADLIHLNGYVHAAMPWRVPVLVVAHSCVFSWWHAVHGHAPPSSKWANYWDGVTTGLQAADLVVAPTRAMLDAVQRHYQHRGPSTVITNARSAREYAPAAKRRVILSAGRIWDPAKNMAALARVAEHLEWPVETAGPQALVEGSHVDWAGVRQLGVLDRAQLSAQLARAEIYALPAFYEPFGLTVLEAALSGCALVLGAIDSLRENWDGAAHFVPPADDAALLNALRDLCNNERLRRGLAEVARVRALEFTPERMAHAYQLAYITLSTTGHRAELPCAS